ncbi:MAG TPA: four-helix bundle copper-binding protein, partial [Methylophilaceae bacterium]|nr:four-helix bundle copper-binding protein [Methylophilaceae bacterium]
CEQCAAECIRMDTPDAAECIELCLDCADICFLDARLMSRDSPYHFDTCTLCARVCNDCADACTEISDPSDSNNLLQQCAEACRRCAASCDEMVSLQQVDEAVGMQSDSEGVH